MQFHPLMHSKEIFEPSKNSLNLRRDSFFVFPKPVLSDLKQEVLNILLLPLADKVWLVSLFKRLR